MLAGGQPQERTVSDVMGFRLRHDTGTSLTGVQQDQQGETDGQK